MATRALLLALTAAAACAAPQPPRDPDSAKRGIEKTKEREPYLPMLPEVDARMAIGEYRGNSVPNLARVAAHMPGTLRAEMAAWAALGKEGTIDRQLLNEVFYVVSDANDCFY
jgi:alkylhydroperoxidase family enzyme